jgi:tetratricopeptide (TPR) repeat protein
MKRKTAIILAATLLASTMLCRFVFATVGNAPVITDPLASFNQAGALYKEGKFDQATAIYEALSARGTPNAALLYKLGNSYYRAQKPGMALIAYERALRLSPRDSDIRFNVAFIRQLAGEPDLGFAQYMFSMFRLTRRLSPP